MQEINLETISQELIEFIRTSFDQTGFTHAVIAMSGGVDSSTSAALAIRALGKENVFPVLLPYGNLNEQGTIDVKAVTKYVEIPQENVVTVDIQPLVDPVIALDPSMDQVRRGNIMARMRMIVLFDQAKKRKALVVGTENKTEHLLGYFTRFGDEASDIEPLRNLYKTQVYELARYLRVPEQIITQKPTAGLWEGQTDEGEFGFTYKDADEILFQLYEGKKSVEDIIVSGFDENIIKKVTARVSQNLFKQAMPLIPARSID